MSRANIISIERDPETHQVYVTFQLHRPPGTRTYAYDPEAGAMILAGADPKDFVGELVSQD
jgi:hypothetical protein